MALFEQRIYEIMLVIVSEIQSGPEKDIWEIEASRWRLPYWDWAASQPYLQNVGIPQLFTTESITVLMPDNTPKDFKNPLARFSNPSGKAMGDTSVMKQWAIPNNNNTYPCKLMHTSEPGLAGVSTPAHSQRTLQSWLMFQPGVFRSYFVGLYSRAILTKSLAGNECIATSRYGIAGSTSDEIEANRKEWEVGINNFAGSNSGLQVHAWGWRGAGEGPDQSTTIQDCVSRMLADDYLKSWRTFSSTAHVDEADPSQPTEFISLEGIHNNIHVSLVNSTTPNSILMIVRALLEVVIPQMGVWDT